MSSISLPQLRPVQVPNALDQFAQLEQLKAMQQQQAEAPLRQQALQQQVQSGQIGIEQQQRQAASQQAIMDAYANSNGDLGKAYATAAKSGKALPGDLIKLRQAQIQTKAQAIDLFTKQGAKAIQDADLYSGAADTIDKAPPEQRPAVYQQVRANLANAGIDVSQLPPQYPGDQQFQMMRLGVQSHKQALTEAKDEAATAASQSTTALNQGKLAYMQQNGGMPGTPTDSDKFINSYLQSQGLPNTPENRLKGQREYIKETKIEPAEVRVEGYGNTREYPVFDSKTKQTVFMTPNDLNLKNSQEPGRYTVPSYSPGALGQKDATNYFISGKGGQQLTAFNTAMSHLDVLDKLAGDLNNSNLQIANKAKQAWAEQTGNPAPANFAAAKNAMSGEVASALKASGATDQEIEKVSQTFSRAQGPMQLKGAIATYRQLLRSKKQQLLGQFNQGMQGQPNFNGSDIAPTGGSSSASSSSDPFAQFGGKAH